MPAFSDIFEVIVSKYGSGWHAIDLEVRNWVRPPELASKKDLVCLTNGSNSPTEWDSQIDGLIAQLEEARKAGHKKLQAIASKTRP